MGVASAIRLSGRQADAGAFRPQPSSQLRSAPPPSHGITGNTPSLKDGTPPPQGLVPAAGLSHGDDVLSKLPGPLWREAFRRRAVQLSVSWASSDPEGVEALARAASELLGIDTGGRRPDGTR